MKKIIISLFVIVFLTSLASASQDSLGTFKEGECIELKQTCSDCSYVNFTRVSYPNGTKAMNNTKANKDGSVFTKEFCNTSQLGNYIVNGIGDVEGTDTVFAYDFEVTPTGNKPTTAQGITYLGIMAITLVFLGLTIFGSIWIKWDNKRNGRDDIIGINELKYGKLGLIFLSYLLLLFLFGIGKDVTQAYLFLSGAYSLFNIGFTILLVGLAPVLISTIAFIIIGIISDKETQKAISRGIDPRHVGRGRR